MSTLDDLRKLRESEAPRFINPHPAALLDYTIRLAEAAEQARRVYGRGSVISGAMFDLKGALDAPIEGLEP